MADIETTQKGQPGLAEAALFGLCPACGAKTLFASPTRFAVSCKSCGLDYSAFNVGDGPAAILTLLLGAVIIAAAIALDIAVRPPFWVHVVILVPLTCLMVLVSLRLAKGALLVAEHRNKAVEGQLADNAEEG
jgi:uncharacterized protein (DUF983 family)